MHDASGANVPGEKVVVANIRTQVSSLAASNAIGLCALAALPPGIYSLTGEAAGFHKTSVSGIELVNSSIERDTK